MDSLTRAPLRSWSRALMLIVIALACKPDAFTAPREPVAEVSVSPPSATVITGRTMQLEATVTDATGATVRGKQVFWSSNDASVATVSQSGVITAVRIGETQVAASVEGRSVLVPVEVVPRRPSAITVSPSAPTVEFGGSVALSATVVDDLGESIEDAAVSWTSEDPSIATVSDAGVVSATGWGTVKIVARSGEVSGAATVTVKEPPLGPPVRLIVSPPEAKIDEDETVQLTATLYDAYDRVVTGEAVKWSSSREWVASVTENGLVRAHKEGKTTITASVGDVSGTAKIEVDD